MKKNRLLLLSMLLFTGICYGNEPPVLTNIKITADAPNRMISITFDLYDREEKMVGIDLFLSSDGGRSFASVKEVSGDAGYPVATGRGKKITLSLGNTNANFSTCKLRIVADDLAVADQEMINTRIDKASLKKNLSLIVGPRNMDDPAALAGHKKTRDIIESTYHANGLKAYRQPFTASAYKGENIIGEVHGADPGKVFVIGAHFDTVKDSPGADDNGSGIIAILELSRILSKCTLGNTVILAGFDLEEKGMLGSNGFVNDELIKQRTITGFINFDMIGYYSNKPNSQLFPPAMKDIYPDVYRSVSANSFRGDFITIIANDRSRDLSVAFERSARKYAEPLKTTLLIVPGNGEAIPDFRRSDHASFWDKGFTAIYLGDGANTRNPHYHSPSDESNTVNLDMVSQVVKATIGFLAEQKVIRHCNVYERPLVAPGGK